MKYSLLNRLRCDFSCVIFPEFNASVNLFHLILSSKYLIWLENPAFKIVRCENNCRPYGFDCAHAIKYLMWNGISFEPKMPEQKSRRRLQIAVVGLDVIADYCNHSIYMVVQATATTLFLISALISYHSEDEQIVFLMAIFESYEFSKVGRLTFTRRLPHTHTFHPTFRTCKFVRFGCEISARFLIYFLQSKTSNDNHAHMCDGAGARTFKYDWTI